MTVSMHNEMRQIRGSPEKRACSSQRLLPSLLHILPLSCTSGNRASLPCKLGNRVLLAEQTREYVGPHVMHEGRVDVLEHSENCNDLNDPIT